VTATDRQSDGAFDPNIGDLQDVNVEDEVIGDVETGQGLPEDAQRTKSGGAYGSAMRRASRNKRPKELPPLLLPHWFWDKNVLLHGHTKVQAGLDFPGAKEIQPSTNTANMPGATGSPFDELLLSKVLDQEGPIRPDHILGDIISQVASGQTWESLPRHISNTTGGSLESHLAQEEKDAVAAYVSELLLASDHIRAMEIQEISKLRQKAHTDSAEMSITTEPGADQDAKACNSQLTGFERTEILSTINKALSVKTTASIISFREWMAQKKTANDDQYAEIVKYIHFLHGERRKLNDTPASSTSIHNNMLSSDILREIVTTLRAGFTLRPPPSIDIKDVQRPDTLLQCPREEGTEFLNEVILMAAAELEVDVLRLGSEDLAQILGNYLDENIGWGVGTTSLLGYEAHAISGKMDTYEKDDLVDEEENVEFDDEDESSSLSTKTRDVAHNLFSGLKPKGFIFSSNTVKVPRSSSQSVPMSLSELFGSPGSQSSSLSLGSSKSAETSGWLEFKLTAALETIIDAVDIRRAQPALLEVSSEPAASSTRGLIVQINEYKELSKIEAGRNILEKLRDIVKKKWANGRRVMIVGTTTSEDHIPATSRSAIRRLQFDVQLDDHRTILVPPSRNPTTDSNLTTNENSHIQNINIRHVEDMVRKLLGNSEVTIDFKKNFPNAAASLADMDELVWSFPQVHRIALTMIGLDSTYEVFEGSHLGKTLAILTASDEAKFAWAGDERKQLDADEAADDESAEIIVEPGKAMEDKIKKIRKTATKHEKKLMGGIITPSEIRTTFTDVRSPPETIEALKTLTSLSLIRPESFSYGVLATNKIPGVLLYGPPGTGKTLLAKAVAKESGATVLEVSGSEVFDMYVGEGEKNVKAIFSLAKKLSPCVVFIDEADAIFGARGDSSKRTSHRELINQFLREWDGMNDLSAFIMVATNRPFDLDEAVLRRLPRRLLIDLPVEKDREAILEIHLKEEIIDDSVSLAKLANRTPFYSGSDLKNMSVAAALACVREENDAAKRHTGDEPYSYPPKRILSNRHFEKAMEEISASISEDMSTLSAIRKFDERYGDRKGRKKRGSALGFGGTTEVEKDSEAGRVRKSIAVNV
jgi:SpoVK/Ycf46/Vps4 family AAA+-type ATPase